MAYIKLENYSRELIIGRVNQFVDIYQTKLATQFLNMEDEAAEVGRRCHEELNAVFRTDYDPVGIAEQAFDIQDEYFHNLNLMKYNTYMMTLSTLYQLWEQQIRSLLYEDLLWREYWPLVDETGKKIEFKNFATNIQEIKAIFACGTWTFEDLPEWEKIDELRIVQNVIKHGEGGAAEQLRRARPDFMNEKNQSTLNRISLTIPDDEIIRYRDAMIGFWQQMPTTVEFIFPNYVSKTIGNLALHQDPDSQQWQHAVSGKILTHDDEIEVKFGKKRWIKGLYRWSGNKDDPAELHSENADDILYLGINHLIRKI